MAIKRLQDLLPCGWSRPPDSRVEKVEHAVAEVPAFENVLAWFLTNGALGELEGEDTDPAFVRVFAEKRSNCFTQGGPCILHVVRIGTQVVLLKRGKGKLKGEECREVFDGLVLEPVLPYSMNVAFLFIAFHRGDEGGGLGVRCKKRLVKTLLTQGTTVVPSSSSSTTVQQDTAAAAVAVAVVAGLGPAMAASGGDH